MSTRYYLCRYKQRPELYFYCGAVYLGVAHSTQNLLGAFMTKSLTEIRDIAKDLPQLEVCYIDVEEPKVLTTENSLVESADTILK